MILSPPLHRLERAASAVDELIDQLGTATARAIEALRDADPAALESALDARGAILPRSGAAFAELARIREEAEPVDLAGVQAVLVGTLRAAQELRTLDATLQVALSAVRDQARAELRSLDRVEANTSRYRPLGQPARGTIDVTW